MAIYQSAAELVGKHIDDIHRYPSTERVDPGADACERNPEEAIV